MTYIVGFGSHTFKIHLFPNIFLLGTSTHLDLSPYVIVVCESVIRVFFFLVEDVGHLRYVLMEEEGTEERMQKDWVCSLITCAGNTRRRNCESLAH